MIAERHFIWIIGLSLLFFSSCKERTDSFTVKGTIDNASGEMIYLSEMTISDYRKIDSFKIGKDRQFILSGQTDHPRFFAIHADKGAYITLIMNRGEEALVKADLNDMEFGYTVSGSTESEKVEQLVNRLEKSIEALMDLKQIFDKNLEPNSILELKKKLDRRYERIWKEQQEYSRQFIREHAGSLSTLMALYQMIGPKGHIFDPAEDMDVFKFVDSTLMAKYPEYEAVEALHKQIINFEERQRLSELQESRLDPGAKAPEIALPNPEGDTILLSSLQGQYVLLDFWASWCPPCRKENPNLVRLYHKHKDQGFEIYQVSLDRSRKEWLRGIREDNLDWVHVSDLQFWNSSVVPIYNIQGIPTNYLLDPEGKIIAGNLRGLQLEAKLEEIFSK